MIEVYFDGLCQPINPGGIACYAFLVKKDGRTVYRDCGIAGEPFSKDSTNNVAEYTALINALNWLLENNYSSAKVMIKSDSQLIVKQLTGDYKVKARRIMDLYKQVLLLKTNFKDVQIDWIPRENNREADRLTNIAYNKALQANPEYLGRVNDSRR